MLKRKYFIIHLLLLFVSCAPVVNYASFDETHRVAKSDSERIDIYTTAKSIPYKFKEIGIISVKYQGTIRTDSEILDIAKNKARSIGADGILYVSENNIVEEFNNSSFQSNIAKFSAIIRLNE